MFYSDDYYRSRRFNESTRARRPLRNSRRSYLSEYRISDFKKDGMTAAKYVTDLHATDRRVRERVYVKEPFYRGIADNWKMGRFSPLRIFTEIEGSRKERFVQTLEIKGFWWNLVNRLIDDGILVIDDVSGDFVIKKDPTRLRNVVTSILKYAVDPKESSMEFAGKCTCPDFRYRGARKLAQKGALAEAYSSKNVFDIDWEGKAPGCKHLYKVCLRTSMFSAKVAQDVIRVLTSQEFLKEIKNEFGKEYYQSWKSANH